VPQPVPEDLLIEILEDQARPRAMLAAVQLPDVTDEAAGASLDELFRLARTLGLDVIDRHLQKRSHFDAATYLGPGKVELLNGLLAADREVHPGCAQFVLVDHEISPSQARQLGKATGAEVMDRTAVILEIFHRHARSREAKAQVEIVRLAYMAPRIREMNKGKGSRQQGGIGAKGAGETHLELDRRKVRDRIAELRAELVRIESDRVTQRSRRQDLRRVALVGYTNAGKSTLMRALTGSDAYVADKLFATLDTTVRALHPPVEPRILVSDTVGFIRNLPHDLVASFKSTLDETLESSLLLHVVDASDPDLEAQMKTTHDVLAEIGAGGIPARLVLNKCDRVADPERLAVLHDCFPDAWFISAKSSEDVALVHGHIVTFFEGGLEEARITLRHDQGSVRALLFQTTTVLDETYDEAGGKYRVSGTRAALTRVREMLG
jgi:GTP-binding protein HflX